VAGTGFTVDPNALRELARQLSILTAKLAQARALTQRVEGSSFGSVKLADATASFTGAWQWQTERLVSTINDAGDRLVQAADQYQTVEDAQLRMQGKKG
jgi:hypothetical protein